MCLWSIRGIAFQISLGIASLMKQIYFLAGFEGRPVMLNDGSLLDSVRLPEDSVLGHPVTVSAASLIQSTTPGVGSAQAYPITFSGGSIMDSEASITPPQPSSPAQEAQTRVYHPVVISQQQDDSLLSGKSPMGQR